MLVIVCLLSIRSYRFCSKTLKCLPRISEWLIQNRLRTEELSFETYQFLFKVRLSLFARQTNKTERTLNTLSDYLKRAEDRD